MKFTIRAALFVLACVPLLGAKGCSDCEKFQAAAEGVCAAAPGTEACKQARAEADAKCNVKPAEPTPPPATCPDGFPPYNGACPPPAEKPPEKPAEPAPADLLDDAKLRAIEGDSTKATWAYTWEILNAVKAAQPALFNAEQTGTAPGASVAGQIEKVYDAMNAACKVKGRVCAQSIKAGVRSDCIFVQREPGGDVFEETHLFEYGGGKHSTSPKAIVGAYRFGAAPPPPEEPPAESLCPAPTPERLWTAASLPPGWDPGLIGKPRFEIDAHPHLQVVDSTPKLVRYCEFCNEVMSDPARCSCPARPDGHPERVGCEDLLLATPPGVHGPRWILAGGRTTLRSCRDAADGEACVTDNPFQADARGHTVRACSWDLAVCSGPVTH